MDSYDGQLVLGAADIEVFPQLAQAFQVQAVPTAVALVKGQPVPLFQGGADEAQVRSLLDELLKVAAANGVTGRIGAGGPGAAGTEAPPLPPLHQKAFDAIEAGDYAAAAADAYRQALLEMPADAEAKAGLAQVELMGRLQPLSAADTEAVRYAGSPPTSRTTSRPSSASPTWTSPADTSRTASAGSSRSSAGTSARNGKRPGSGCWNCSTSWAPATTASRRRARTWPGCSSSGIRALHAAGTALPAAAAPRLGVADVPVQLRAGNRRRGPQRLAPDAPGLLRHRRGCPDPHRGGCRERRRAGSARATPDSTTTTRRRRGNAITAFVHRHGTAETKIGTQLAHAGRKASSYWPFSGKKGTRGCRPTAAGPPWVPAPSAFDGYDAAVGA